MFSNYSFRSDVEHLRSVFMAVENGDLGMLKSLGIKDSELGDVKFFLEKLVNTGFLDWVAPDPASGFYYAHAQPINSNFYSYLGTPYDNYNYWKGVAANISVHSVIAPNTYTYLLYTHIPYIFSQNTRNFC